MKSFREPQADGIYAMCRDWYKILLCKALLPGRDFHEYFFIFVLRFAEKEIYYAVG